MAVAPDVAPKKIIVNITVQTPIESPQVPVRVYTHITVSQYEYLYYTASTSRILTAVSQQAVGKDRGDVVWTSPSP